MPSISRLFCLIILCMGMGLAGCAGSFGVIDQRGALDKRLENYALGPVEPACDGCDFLVRDSVSKHNSEINPSRNTLSRAQSGVKLYMFDGYSLEEAFIALIESNIFTKRMNKDYREALIDALRAGENDFRGESSKAQIGFESSSTLSFGKRLNNPVSEPRALLDSVEILQNERTGWRYSDSMEAFFIDGNVMIVHYYSQNEIWIK